jgi:hypothetical protein
VLYETENNHYHEELQTPQQTQWNFKNTKIIKKYLKETFNLTTKYSTKNFNFYKAVNRCFRLHQIAQTPQNEQ